ncbi:hypothetical protein BT63DRAFT_21472 [Microthyrium microscopicum]|uniref:Pantetheine-phosphate adenylyltransferase family protein-like protein n=1 Tax=Microthyrium microscopicum TaxID=703497 RepID=A0A6A6USR1_9PEZI|nr:hypothetical protein BT63DRAFT_21472 [Microthyrium microscopicum]
MTSSSPQSLLLLPPIPEPATYPTVKATYQAPLLLALRQLKETISGRCILDIALPCPHLYKSSASRAELYAQTQAAVANVYKLVSIIAARQNIETADVDGDAVDVRVLLIAYPRNGILEVATAKDTSGWFGPVVELSQLAESGRAWDRIWSVETEQGEQLVKNFKTLWKGSKAEFSKLRGGVVQVDKSASKSVGSEVKRSNSVCVGGTFDHLHIGHKLLLTMTAFALDPPADGSSEAEKTVTIGMTAADLLAKKQYAELLQSWRTRTDRTHAFLRGIMLLEEDKEQLEEVHNPGPNGHALLVRISTSAGNLLLRYVEIWDPFGPTITDPTIETLIVSAETRSGGKMVNDKRNEVDMASLIVLEVDVLDASEEEKLDSDLLATKLSSTEIRKRQQERLKRQSRV